MIVSHPYRVNLMVRWLRFNLVGLLGILVQLSLLEFLSRVGAPLLWATGTAVEVAVLHNWLWHERYTWSDRVGGGIRAALVRLLRFNVTNGAVSLLGNVLIMDYLAGHLRVPLLAANMVSITVCSVVNFMLGDRVVFRQIED